MAGAATEQDDIRTGRMPVDDEVMIRRNGINTGLHREWLGSETSEVTINAWCELRGILVAGFDGLLTGVDALAEMFIMTNLQRALRVGIPYQPPSLSRQKIGKLPSHKGSS